MLELKNVTKKYGKVTALNGVSLVFARGEAVAVAGPNGGGKTTMLSIAAGVLRPTEGAALYEGTALAKIRRVGRTIGFLPQYDALFGELSAADNLKFWAAAAGVKVSRLRENEYVNALGLGDMLKKPAHKLSGGQRRRLSICARLMSDCRVLVLDEPMSGVDAQYKQGFMAVLRRLRDEGRTVIYSTHGEGEIEGLADRVITLDRGAAAYD